MFVGAKSLHTRQEKPTRATRKQRKRYCYPALCLFWFKLQSKSCRPLKCHLCFWGEPTQQRSHIEGEPNHAMQVLDRPGELYSLSDFMTELLSLKLHSWVWRQHRLSFTHLTSIFLSYLIHLDFIHSVPSFSTLHIMDVLPPFEVILFIPESITHSLTSLSCQLPLPWYGVCETMQNIYIWVKMLFLRSDLNRI